MPVRGVKQVRQNISRVMGEISGTKAENAITEALIIGGGMAAKFTPVDTSNLINSQYRFVRRDRDAVRGQMGYTAMYAAAVHAAKGTLRGEPRDPNDGRRGNFWDPSAEPEFLTKGFEESKADIDAAIKRNMKL